MSFRASDCGSFAFVPIASCDGLCIDGYSNAHGRNVVMPVASADRHSSSIRGTSEEQRETTQSAFLNQNRTIAHSRRSELRMSLRFCQQTYQRRTEPDVRRLTAVAIKHNRHGFRTWPHQCASARNRQQRFRASMRSRDGRVSRWNRLGLSSQIETSIGFVSSSRNDTLHL